MDTKPPDTPDDMMVQIKNLWKRNETLLEDRRKLLVEIRELNFGLKRCHDRLDALKKIVNWEDKDELPRTDKGNSEV